MDTVTVDGKEYVKAAKAASEAGYTSDYVGQLCRGGKISAILLGKTWYVAEGALTQHKQSRVRTNTGMVKRDLVRQKEEVSRPTSFSAQYQASPYRTRLLDQSISYTTEAQVPLPVPTARPSEGISPVVNEVSVNEVLADTSDTVESPEYVGDEEEGATAFGINTQEAEQPQVGTSQEGAGTVSIRRINTPRPSARRKFLEKALMAQTETSQHTPVRGNKPKKSVTTTTLSVPKEHSLTFRRVLLPMALATVAVVFVVANVLLESTWNYTHTDSGDTAFSTQYHFVSLASVIDSLQSRDF